MSEKNSVPVMVRMPPKMEANLRMLAEFQGIETPEMVRRAIKALIACYAETGSLPTHFKLVGVDVPKPILLVAEDDAEYKPGPAKGIAPEKPPDKSKRARGDGPRRAVS